MHALTLTAVIALALAGAWAHHRTTHRLEELMATQEETQAAVDAVAAQETKAFGEIRGLLDALQAQITDLQTQVDAGNTIDLTGVQAAAQALDDIVVDAPPAEPAAG